MISWNKTAILTYRYIRSVFRHSIFFVYFAPTRACNLECSYCYQKDMQKGAMSFENFITNLDICSKLGMGIVSFTGGEPLLWEHIYKAVATCSQRNMLTEITTNGLLLTKDVIDDLSNAGLDYLMLSIDAIKRNKYSVKTLEDNPSIVSLLKYAQQEKGMLVSCNSVLSKYNASEIGTLIKVLTAEAIPVSIGFVDAPLVDDSESYSSLKFDLTKNHELIHNVISEIVELKRQSALIIEPEDYFLNYPRHLKGERTWHCRKNDARSFTITPEGDLLICSRLKQTLGSMSAVTAKELVGFRKRITQQLELCNPSCYSNCSFNSCYYQSYPISFFTGVVLPAFLARLKGRSIKVLAQS